MQINELTHLDLFSGIGGFALAAKWNGFRTLAFCDNEPYAQAVLKKHWPDVPCHKDIREVRGDLYAGVTLLTGGFPCQPFSVAGKQRGKGDDRYLWPEMLRVIREARPAWIIGENVAGIVNLALDQVHTDLEAEGYEVESLIIPACGVDAPHRRDRVWIVAHSKGGERGRIQDKGGAKGSQDCDQLSGITGGLFGESRSSNVANPKGNRTQGRVFEPREKRDKSWKNGNVVANAISQRRCGWNTEGQYAEDAWRSSGHPWDNPGGMATWLPEPDVGRVANGIPNRIHRLKGLGNAIVPQVAAEIIRCIRIVHEVAQLTKGEHK